MDVEAEVIAYLSRKLSVHVSADVPRDRPPKFVTVERTGGGSSDLLDHPTLAIQSWAASRALASALSHDVDRAMRELPYNHPDVSQCSRESLADWPDPDSKTARYQGTYTLTTS